MTVKPARLIRDDPYFDDERSYEEDLKHIGGSLNVGLEGAYIFLVLINKYDARYNSRSLKIEEEDINYYIRCLKKVFATYKEKKKELRPTQFLEQGYSSGMVLRVNMPDEGVAIHEWADPITTEEELNAVIGEFKYAKKRIKFLRERLVKLSAKGK